MSRPEQNWDMTPYFPEFDGAEYRRFRGALGSELDALANELEELDSIDSGSAARWAVALARLEQVNARTAHVSGYLGCLGAADSTDEGVQRETAALAEARAALEKLYVRVRAELGSCDEAAFELLLAQPPLEDTDYFLRRLRERADFSMEPELEGLAADLGVTGLGAWGRLYDRVSGRLEFDLELEGRETQRLPMSVTRSLLEDADPDVRRAALLGSNRAWQSVADVVAACLNAIAGTRLRLYERRGIAHFLDPALFDAAISRKTLDALLGVVEARQDVARRFLRLKAKTLGREQLGFQDLMAPLPMGSAEPVPWERARREVEQAFEGFYPELGAFAAEAFERRWIDYEPRLGKRPGGFCSSSSVIEESRIFMTYNGAPGDVSTLAHELGHAFHARLMRGMRPWSRRYPMTLAETASTFAEQVVLDALLEDPAAPAEQQAIVLDGRLGDAATFLLNIPMRFWFEQAFYEERARGEVSVARLGELMCDAQRRSYGDCLAPDELDPLFWASKLHFYIVGTSFYNFPYTFGYLFSLGLFARAREEGPDFRARYEELLRLTGSDTAEEIARRCLEVDLEGPEFWNASIDLIEADLHRFEHALEEAG